MNLSEVRAIYKPISKATFEALVRKPKVYKKSTKVVAQKTVDKIAKLIKTNRKVTRDYLFQFSGQSKTTSEAAIRIIFEKGLIRKEKNRMLPNNPVVYVWNKKDEKLQVNC